MADVHFFDIDIAKQYGIHCAVILQNIWHWIKKNEANGVNFYDGTYWTYNSTKAYSELFPYLTQRQIETALKKLRDDGIIITGNYNAVKYDRTLWYAVTEKGKSILHGCEMETTKKVNGNTPDVKPIPNINTDTKQPDNKPERKKESKPTGYDEIISQIADDDLRELYLDYIKMRKMIKAPMTDRALTLLIQKVNKLEPHSVDRQKKMLETAIVNNWKSVYPLKDEEPKQSQKKQSNNVFLDMLENGM